MTKYRPLSKVGVYDEALDTLHDGLPPWMHDPILAWMRSYLFTYGPLGGGAETNMEFVHSLGMALRVREPFGRSDRAGREVLNRMSADGKFAIDAIGFALSRTPPGDVRVLQLEGILSEGGSRWQVADFGAGEEPRFGLVRRDLEAAKHAISEIESASSRAHSHLVLAWRNVATREPNPDGGYDQAIKAIEAAAKPIVSPDNDRTTLGTLIRDMRAKPEKWTFALGNMDLIIEMADRIWTNHARHGTQERTHNTLEEADAALHMAIPLVRYFAGGLISVV